jgi:hypothetical protein
MRGRSAQSKRLLYALIRKLYMVVQLSPHMRPNECLLVIGRCCTQVHPGKHITDSSFFGFWSLLDQINLSATFRLSAIWFSASDF